MRRSHIRDLVLLSGCFILILASCTQSANYPVPLEDLVAVPNLHVPSNWHEANGGQSADALLQMIGAREGYYRVWMPDDGVFARLHVAAYLFDGPFSARLGYRRLLRELEEHGCRVSPMGGEGRRDSTGYVMLCCAPSVKACNSLQRYGCIVVEASLTEGSGLSLDHAPGLFVAVSKHVEQVLTHTY